MDKEKQVDEKKHIQGSWKWYLLGLFPLIYYAIFWPSYTMPGQWDSMLLPLFREINGSSFILLFISCFVLTSVITRRIFKHNQAASLSMLLVIINPEIIPVLFKNWRVFEDPSQLSGFNELLINTPRLLSDYIFSWAFPYGNDIPIKMVEHPPFPMLNLLFLVVIIMLFRIAIRSRKRNPFFLIGLSLTSVVFCVALLLPQLSVDGHLVSVLAHTGLAIIITGWIGNCLSVLESKKAMPTKKAIYAGGLAIIAIWFGACVVETYQRLERHSDYETWIAYGLEQQPANSALLVEAAKIDARNGEFGRARAYLDAAKERSAWYPEIKFAEAELIYHQGYSAGAWMKLELMKENEDAPLSRIENIQSLIEEEHPELSEEVTP